MPQISSELRKELEAPISLEELQSAIGATKPGKAPGPDSFTLQYYKQLLPTLSPYMVKLFNALGSLNLQKIR